eukprot:scaffold37473_cov62-Phaeocystis_antarctica.AAC.2
MASSLQSSAMRGTRDTLAYLLACKVMPWKPSLCLIGTSIVCMSGACQILLPIVLRRARSSESSLGQQAWRGVDAGAQQGHLGGVEVLTVRQLDARGAPAVEQHFDDLRLGAHLHAPLLCVRFDSVTVHHARHGRHQAEVAPGHSLCRGGQCCLKELVVPRAHIGEWVARHAERLRGGERERLGDIQCGILGVRRVEIPNVRLTDH